MDTTAQTSKSTVPALMDNAGPVPASGDEHWQQQALLACPPRTSPRAARPSERMRQAGLVGIAQARAALAEASRRASSHHQAA